MNVAERKGEFTDRIPTPLRGWPDEVFDLPKWVVTIHGIDTAGEWQEDVERVLTPHFECVKIKYSDYRRFGALRLSFGSVRLIGIGLLLLLYWCIAEIAAGHRIRASGALFSILLVTVFGIFLARRRRSNTLRQFKEQLDRRLPFGESAHLIAHSFGTFLAGNALVKFPNLRFDRIVFAGCILPRGFAWTTVLKVNPKAFTQLRNEIAAKDWVPRVADLAKFLLLLQFGSAGALGFFERSGIVHTVDTPNQVCKHCGSLVEMVKIHNVIYREYTHSDHFVGVGHAESFWLPYLWQIDPCEFRDFIDMCALAVSLEEERNWLSLQIVESELRERSWAWAGMTLEEFVERQFDAILGTPGHDDRFEGLVSRAVRLVWHAVRMAQEEQHKDVKNPVVAKRLYPKLAVCSAVASVIEAED